MVHSVRERERQNDREREKDRMLQKRKHEGEERGRKKEKRVATKVAMTDKETRSREKRRQKCILQVRQHLSASSISCNWKLSSSGYGECWFRTDKRKEKPVEDENKIKCKMKTMNCKFWRKLILLQIHLV
nr:zinc finger CCCH domain-containing protein 13-like [Arachis hypogaea]